MSDTTSHQAEPFDLSYVQDPDMRRALRAMWQQIQTTLHRQQIEIDAMLEMIMEKQVGSMGEFKRHLVRLQQNSARSQRIHDMVNSTAQAGAAPPPGSGSGHTIHVLR
jgi:hypothetical protein